jgi:flagellar hook-length control protein FliK
MHLARVTTGRGGHTVDPAAATGGDADPLALLLGEEGGAEAQAFPAALQAALVESDTADEALDVVDGEVGDGDAGGEDEAGTGIAAAFAVALALGGIAVPPPTVAPADGDAVAVQDEAAAGGTATAVDVAGGATKDALVAEAIGGTGPDAGTSAGATAVMPAPTSEQAMSPTSGAVDAPARAVPQTDAVAPAAASTTLARAEAGEPALARPESAALHREASRATNDTVGKGVPDSGAHGAVAVAPFSSGGSAQQHGLDLGTSERQAFASSLERTAGTLTTATTPGSVGEAAQHATTTSGGAPTDATNAVPTTTTTTGTVHAAPSARPERATAHPGGIEARWGERVADALRLSAVRGGGEIRLQLEPEGLGHIDVRLHLEPDGVRAIIVAEHESTRALLTSQQHVLQDAFNRSDLRLSGFSVDVGSGGGAATSGQGEETGQGGSAPAAPSVPASAASVTEGSESTAAPVANGRVNVRV